jgi:superfamily I DNA/RNA helicase
VLAGPGAGKTYCLTERIRFLIQRHDVDPARICAFTFTNKAAGEIAHRLQERLREPAEKIKRGTIHAFCAELLRDRGAHVGLAPGFGIADEDYQVGVLRRIEGYRRWHRNVLNRFSAHRFRGDALLHDDLGLLEKYERFLADRNVVDFDTLVIKAAELLERTDVAAEIRARWDVVLVDEFQDLNPVQYRVVKALAADHHHVFAVGDHEQSIYSWAGAERSLFTTFLNDFDVAAAIHLEENYRCPRNIFALARTLVAHNPRMFSDDLVPRADRESPFPVRVAGFATDDEEAAWVIDDVRRDHAGHGRRWGDVAILYRKHQIGDRLESAFLNAGIPCRLAQGRALIDDKVIGYAVTALRVIARPHDDVLRDEFFRIALPRSIYDEALARAEANRHDLRRQLNHMVAQLPRVDATGRRIRRTLAEWKNLVAVGKQHATLASLVQGILSRPIGRAGSPLEEHHDEISDPATNPEVVALATRLTAARDRKAVVWLPAMGGVDIAIKGMLVAIGLPDVRRGGSPPPGAECIGADEVPSLGIALGMFKAAQLVEMGDSSAAFTSFTAVDLETTDKAVDTAEIVEIAAVRVRDGQIAQTFASFVKPNGPIAAAATATHGITDADVASAPAFEDVWPIFREFCGDDVVVAHNGYDFDFRVLTKAARALGKKFDLTTYDSLPLARALCQTSCKLSHLAQQFGIPPGRSHRALDDTLTLARVLLALGDLKRSRARKTALVNLLDFLGVALALCDESALVAEAAMFRKFTRVYALGRYSGCLEWYEREQGDDISAPGVDEVIESLGGAGLMVKIRTEKSADERYPAAMARLRRLIAEIPAGPLDEQLTLFLERAALSKWDGHEPEHTRVNLLTLHSTKGLEFSRVYVVGAEDAQLPGGSPSTGPKPEEIEEARRLLYVGMTRTIDRLVLTRTASRGGKPTGGHRFLDEMQLAVEQAGDSATGRLGEHDAAKMPSRPAAPLTGVR